VSSSTTKLSRPAPPPCVTQK